MEDRISKIEEKLIELSYRLDFNDETDKTRLKSVKELTSFIESNNTLTQNFIEKFELLDLKLKNIETEFELIHTEIRTLKIQIETLNIITGNQ